MERGEGALDLMEATLSAADWFVGDDLSLADISLLAYTRLAHEGGFDLNDRPNVRRWIQRSEAELGISAADL